MRTAKFLWKAFTIACWLVFVLLLLSPNPKWQAWGLIGALWGIALCMVRPVMEMDEEKKIHRRQMESLRRFHAMQARDRREREHRAWWKGLGIKP